MGDIIRWGILGTGVIANKFAKDLLGLSDARLTAVGSRQAETANAFGDAYQIPHRYASYEALCQSPEVDVIYIASPHSHHYEHMLLAIAGGKHILCEKAFTLTEAQAKEVFAAARKKGVHVTEAMWTRFLPANTEIKKRIDAGELGDLATAWAFFGHRFPDEWDVTHRIFNPALGGGAALDLGVYSTSYISFLAGDREPAAASFAGKLFAPTGVDSQIIATLSYDGDFMGVAGAAIRTTLSDEGFIAGSKGSIRVPNFWNPMGFTLNVQGRETYIDCPRTIGGYAYEAKAVMDDIRAGRLENAVMPHEATLLVMRLLDQARHSLGFYYPCEQ